VVLGLQGKAEVEGGGIRNVEGPDRDQARAQAKRILWRSIVIAAVVTLAIVLATGLSFTLE
jgi:hypothetical protein